jgi:hypothetical protein
MEEKINETRYKLYLKRALIQAHLEVVDDAIQQHNRFLGDIDHCYTPFRSTDEELYDKYLRMIEGSE